MGALQVMDKRKIENNRVKDSIMFAFFELFSELPISKISVSEITKRAGVARKSYYRNFQKKEDVLQYFYDKILNEAMTVIEDNHITTVNDAYITQVLIIIKKYGHVFLTLHSKGYTAYGMEIINEFMEITIGYMPASSIERYWLYLLSGAFYNATIKWLQDGAKESPERMAEVIGNFRVSLINNYHEYVSEEATPKID